MDTILKEQIKNHTVIIDGVCAPKTNPAHERLLIACRAICRNENTCKLVIARSMEVIGERIANNPTSYSLHKVSSWMLDDYYGAIENIDFFKSVAKKLDGILTRRMY